MSPRLGGGAFGWSPAASGPMEPIFGRDVDFHRTSIVAALSEPEGNAMVHAAFFYMVVIVLSVGMVASYFIPLP